MIVVRGCDLQETKESDLDAAVAAAGQADVVMLAVGESFVLNVQSLGYWLSNGACGVEPGDFSVWAGLDTATQNQADFRME